MIIIGYLVYDIKDKLLAIIESEQKRMHECPPPVGIFYYEDLACAYNPAF